MPSSYLFLNEIRMHYLHWDRDGGGKPVVLLHDLSSSARVWEKVAPYLVQAGLAPLAPDLRGHGLTDPLEGELHLEALLRDLAAFIDAAHLERPLLVGHAWGGLLALDFASRVFAGPRAPSGLALLDGGVVQAGEAGTAGQEAALQSVLDFSGGLSLDDFDARLSSAWPGWFPDEQDRQCLLAGYELDEDEKLQPRLPHQTRIMALKVSGRYPLYERYRQVRCPVLLAPARPPQPLTKSDIQRLDLVEKGLARAREEIADLQVYWLQDSFSQAPLQKPEEVAGLIAGFTTKQRG